MFVRRIVLAVLACTIAATAEAQPWSPTRADSHAPLGVMGDHTHEVGGFMLSFRYMRMSMDGNRLGTDSLATDAVLAEFPVAPLRMPMDMYMVGGMYAPTDRVTLMGMVPVLGLSMDHRTRMGGMFTTEASGIGDVRATALIGLLDGPRQRLHLNIGIGLPTGSIDERDDTPIAMNVRLPYPMQIGSGTWDLLPGLTYLGQTDAWSWGAQGIGTVRAGENDNAYTLGDRFLTTAWLSRLVTPSASLSVRLAVDQWGNLSGADPLQTPRMVPTADPARRSGTRADLGVGLNLYGSGDVLSGHRLALELLAPIYQDLSGPQLETDWTLVVGWQKSFTP